jgi:hypothetical protein
MERTGKAWPAQTDAEWERARLLAVERRRLFMLEDKILRRLRRVMGAPDVVVRGFDPQGRDAVVPGRIVSQLQFDLLKGTLSTPDYGVAWHTVTVEMVPEARALLAKAVEGRQTPDDREVMGSPDPSAASPPLPRKGGRKPMERDGMVTYLETTYPSGVPANIKNKTLLHSMHEAGVAGSDKTLGRAMRQHREALAKTK